MFLSYLKYKTLLERPDLVVVNPKVVTAEYAWFYSSSWNPYSKRRDTTRNASILIQTDYKNG